MDTVNSESKPLSQPHWMTIAGWVLTILPTLMFVGGGAYAASNPQMMQEGMKENGWPSDVAPYLIALEIICGLIYIFPKTSILGAIEPGYKADLTIVSLADPSFVPLNSAARQLVHAEAGRAVESVIVDGRVVLRDRKLTTMTETSIYSRVEQVMPEFRRDFGAISQRIASLQPYLDEAHRRIWAAPVGTPRMTPF